MESSKPRTRRNPYIIGRPVYEREEFFGRESLFKFIEDNLKNDQQVILLHGQRRIGKSSVLSHIPNFVDLDEFEFVYFDLQDKSRLPLSGVLDSFARDIVDHLSLDPDRVALPSVAELKKAPEIFSRNFLPEVERALGSKKLVLLIDEFDVLSEAKYDESFEHFFDYLNKIIKQRKNRLFIIPVVGRQLDDMPKLLNLFKGSPTQEIGFLDDISAKRLIIDPAQYLYDEDAIEAILKLSSGHPYFTQVICFALFGQARDRDNWRVSREDVDRIVDKAIENAEGGLTWYWEGLPIPEQVIFSAVAEAQIVDPLIHLKEYGVIQTDSLLEEAVQRLIDKKFLDDSGRKIKIELVRRWLVRRYPLRQEIWNLEKVDPEAHSIYEQAVKLEQRRTRLGAKNFYKEILELNPNHFSSLLKLAEIFLDSKDFPKAVELYTRGYKLSPVRTQDKYVRSLLSYGDDLLKNKNDLYQAKITFEEILKIDPENAYAREKKQKIETFKPQELHMNNRQSIILWSIVAGVLGVIAISLSIYIRELLPTNPPGQNGILCELTSGRSSDFYVPTWERKRFSRGDCALFPIPMDNMEYTDNQEKGIKAFKNGKYSEAVDFFSKAVNANRKDPEVLIYYNNARAREQGSPFTLAAVVSVVQNKDSAQEMLRGVAQAQNNFNNSGGLNGRLLEIVIANDDNEPEKSIKVAQELVKDKDVLGVIGHHASNASRAALDAYEKAGLATISPSSTSTLLTGNVFFRTVPSDSAAGKKLAEYVRNSIDIEKVVIFYNPFSLYSNSLQGAFTENFIQLGGRVVERIDLTNQNLNLRAIVSKSVFEDGAEAALLFPNTAKTSVALNFAQVNANLIAASNNPERRGLKLLGGASLYSQTTLNEGGQAVEGLILAVHWFREAPESENFSEAAKEQWGGPVSWRTATSFDATQAFIKALSPNASRSAVLLRLARTDISSRETSGDPLQFTPEGERESESVLVKVVRNGSEFAFELVE